MSVSNITNSRGLINGSFAGGGSGGNVITVLDNTAYGQWYTVLPYTLLGSNTITQTIKFQNSIDTPYLISNNAGTGAFTLTLPGVYNVSVSYCLLSNSANVLQFPISFYLVLNGATVTPYSYVTDKLVPGITSTGTAVFQVQTTAPTDTITLYMNGGGMNNTNGISLQALGSTPSCRICISKVDVDTAGVQSVSAGQGNSGISVSNGTSNAVITNTGVLSVGVANGIINTGTAQQPVLQLQSGAGGIQQISAPGGPGIVITSPTPATRLITNNGVTSLQTGYGLNSVGNATTGNLQISTDTTNACLVKTATETFNAPGGFLDTYYTASQGGTVGVNVVDLGGGDLAFEPSSVGTYTLTFSGDYSTDSTTDITVTFMLATGVIGSGGYVILNTGKKVVMNSADGVVNFVYSINIDIDASMVGEPLYPRLNVAGLGGSDTFSLVYTAGSGTGVNTIAASPASTFSIFKV